MIDLPHPSNERPQQYTIRDLTPFLFLALFVALGASGAEPVATRGVAVKVVDRIGRPVKDVSACLLPECSKVAMRAEKDGFVAEVPASGKTVGLRFTARSFEAAEVKVAPEALVVEATLKAKGSVRVSFLAVDEKRPGKLTVSLKETVDPQAGTRGRLLAERGVSLEPRPAQNAVVLDDAPPGDWVLWWEGPSIAAGMKVVKVAETRADAGSVALADGRSVEGAVRDDLGVVVSGARVRLRTGGPTSGRPGGTDRSARTGSDGSFAVSGLPLDEVLSWDVTSPEHEDARGTLGGETRLEVGVTRAQRVSGRLVDEEGLPVAGVAIGISYVTETFTKDKEGHERRSTMVEGHPGQVVAGEDGRFTFYRRLPASAQVAPDGSGHLPETHTLEALGEGAERGERDLGDLVLRKGRTLTGRVARADDGAPVAGASLAASWAVGPRGPFGSSRDVSREDGSFRIDAILPGHDVTLTARKEGLSPRTVKVDPDADSVDVLLGRGGRVRGRVCGTAWEMAAAAIWYGLDGGISNRNQAAVDPSGHFVLEHAETGLMTFTRSWRFRNPAQPGAMFEWGGQVGAFVEVKEGDTAQVSIGCDGILLSGVLTRGGRPAASEIVTLSLGGVMSDALTDAVGTFSTRVPSPGRWLLSAGGSPLADAASCEVPPGGLEGCRVELAPGH